MSGRGQFFLPSYRAHCCSRGDTELVVILQCQNCGRFCPPPALALSSCYSIWPCFVPVFVPSPLLGWIFLCSQCGESILLTWCCLLQIKAAMGCSHSQFDPHGIRVSFPSKRSSGNAPRGGTPYNGLYGEAPPDRGTWRLQVQKRVGISQVQVYKRVGKSVI